MLGPHVFFGTNKLVLGRVRGPTHWGPNEREFAFWWNVIFRQFAFTLKWPLIQF